MLALGDPRAGLTSLARWNLGSLARRSAPSVATSRGYPRPTLAARLASAITPSGRNGDVALCAVAHDHTPARDQSTVAHDTVPDPAPFRDARRVGPT